MNQSLVSIILPTYNGAAYLAESIESCLAQTHARFELILVDDASTDDTPEIIGRYTAKDDRVRGVRNRRNMRLPGSLNVGFALARGDYLTWTSDDNLYKSDALTLMLEYLAHDPTLAFVYSDCQRIDEQGQICGRLDTTDVEHLGKTNCVGACFLYRRDVYERIGDYDAEMFLVEDYEYWLRVRKQFRMKRIPDVAPYLYRDHSGSLTVQRATAIRLQRARAQARHVIPAAERRMFLAKAYWNAADEARGRGDAWLAARYFTKCIQLGRRRRAALAALGACMFQGLLQKASGANAC